jgi:oligopeptide/dipeptide ABC transporter ATP-binding protein
MSSILQFQNLHVDYPVRRGLLSRDRGTIRAVDGVSLSIEHGEIVALVGESGCGKTTLARAAVGLVRVTGGELRFEGRPVSPASKDYRTTYRRRVQMIFQDPFESLNPRKTVFQALAQPLRIHAIVPRSQLRSEAARLLELVGLYPGTVFLNRYPHQFSGGQRQRICIARALAVRPALIVADEAVSALDMSVRAQVLVLLLKLQQELGLSYLFITHDLSVVRSLAQRVLVMYMGEIVEEGPVEEIFTCPRHPYTVALLNASPVPDPAKRYRPRLLIGGDVPNPADPPPGCRFHTRCPIAQPICGQKPPVKLFGTGHRSACFFADEVPESLVTRSD